MTRPDAIEIDAAQSLGEAVDDRSIAIRPEDVARAVGEDQRFGLGEHASALHDAIVSVIEIETGTFRRELDRIYAPHNPDRDTIACDDAPSGDEPSQRLCAALAYAFDKANFRRLGDVDVEEAMKVAGRGGLKVKLNPDGVQSLQLFVRGSAQSSYRRRRWNAPIKGVEEDMEVYRRLGVIVQPKDGADVLLRLYRDIPVADIETLLPHAEIAMTWTDRLKIACGGAGALGGIGTKVVTGGLLLSPSTLAVPAAVAFGGLGVKSFLGYRRARSTRVSQRTHHLYNLSIASNAAVLHVLSSMVSAQEVNEALLLYAMLGSTAHADQADTKSAIERWIGDRFRIPIDFELEDALETLDRLGLWDDRSSLKVSAPTDALERLHRHLQRGPRLPYHLERAGLAERNVNSTTGQA